MGKLGGLAAIGSFGKDLLSKALEGGGKWAGRLTKGLVGLTGIGAAGYGALELDQSIRGQSSIKTGFDTNQAAAAGAAASAGTWTGIKEAFANFLELLAVVFNTPGFAKGLRSRLTEDKTRLNGDITGNLTSTVNDVSNALTNNPVKTLAATGALGYMGYKVVKGRGGPPGGTGGTNGENSAASAVKDSAKRTKPFTDNNGRVRNPDGSFAKMQKSADINTKSPKVKGKLGAALKLGSLFKKMAFGGAAVAGATTAANATENSQTLTGEAIGIAADMVPGVDVIKDLQAGDVDSAIENTAGTAGGLTAAFAAAAPAAAAGAAIGTFIPVPVVGTAVGWVAGTALGLTAYVAGDAIGRGLSKVFKNSVNDTQPAHVQALSQPATQNYYANNFQIGG